MKWKIRSNILTEIENQIGLRCINTHNDGLGSTIVVSAQSVYNHFVDTIKEKYGMDYSRLPRCLEDDCQHLFATQRIVLANTGKTPPVSIIYLDKLASMWNDALRSPCIHWNQDTAQ